MITLPGGCSAGGHVAAGTALFAGVDEEGEDTSVSCTPNALVLYYPVIFTEPGRYYVWVRAHSTAMPSRCSKKSRED